ncbi:MAG: type II toxin-antitoxin system MqsA family antitoxin [Schwartzia sp.]|nr:type II toxin-antitoxin system MqsA family antitoxin [Schwartzia sp. (in: firmicutes)]
MSCLICKSGTMRETTGTYFAQLKKCYVIIENVPCRKCEQCGEVVYSSSVMERIDEILGRLEKVASKIFIMDYATAA